MASANDNIQVACIGFGIMGQGDCQTAVTVPGVKLVAVADVYDGRQRKAKEVYGSDVFTTRDYREVLAKKEIDAVIVATPDHWHSKISIDAMNAGKDVYCQKPMVQNLDEGKPVIEVEQKTKRIFQVGSQRVSNILYAKARDLISQGVIGKVHMVESWLDRNSAQGAWQYSIPSDASPSTIDWDRFLGRAPKRSFEPIRLFRWRNYQDYGTGIGGDLFVHLFSGIHYVMNTMGPDKVATFGGLHYWKDGRDVPDLLIGMYDYPETQAHPSFQLSLRCNLEAGSAGPDGQGFRFIGTDGVLNLNVGSGFTITRRPINKDPGTTSQTFDRANAEKIIADHQKQYPREVLTSASLPGTKDERYTLPRGYTEQYAHHETFFNAVRSRKPVTEDASFGFRAAAPALLSNISYFEKKLCLWDPEKMTMKS